MHQKLLNKSVTSKDVAKLAGVSQSTVSRVFNEATSTSVKPKMKEKVMKAADALGYRPNLVARGMISGKTNLVALVVGGNLGPFYNRIIDTFTKKIQEIGKQCLVFKVQKYEQLDEIIEKVLQFHVEAAVVTASAMTKEMAETMMKNEIPVVLFNRFICGLDISTIYVDPVAGGGLVAEYLYKKGHRNIGYIHYHIETEEETEKKIGFYSKLRQFHVYQIQEEVASYSYREGYEAAVRLLNVEKPPTAIFATSDLIAIGAIDAARYELGLRVPEDLAVIGYDDIDMSEWKSYDLTSVRQPIEEMVDKTIKTIKNMLDGMQEPRIEMISPQLVERGSAMFDRTEEKGEAYNEQHI